MIFSELTPERIAKFWSKVDIRGNEDCWPWIGGKNGGYGMLFFCKGSYNKQTRLPRRAHRVSLTISLGRDIGPGMICCHTCNNTLCVNPRHLYEGSEGDNAADRRVARIDESGGPQISLGRVDAARKEEATPVAQSQARHSGSFSTVPWRTVKWFNVELVRAP